MNRRDGLVWNCLRIGIMVVLLLAIAPRIISAVHELYSLIIKSGDGEPGGYPMKVENPGRINERFVIDLER